VSNQSKETRVWFDDLRVMHTQSIVVQATDYGVWGDVLREQKTDESIYRFGYQGQFAEKDEETGWNHFELREYDANIGRWLVVYPYRQYYSSYLAMANDPLNVIDKDGGCAGRDCPDVLIQVNGDPIKAWYVNKLSELYAVKGSWTTLDEILYSIGPDHGGFIYFGDKMGPRLASSGTPGRASSGSIDGPGISFADPKSRFLQKVKDDFNFRMKATSDL